MSHLYNSIIISVIIGLIIGFFIGKSFGSGNPVSEKQDVVEEVQMSEYVTVSNQNSGNVVLVQSVVLREDGWVAVREIIDSEMGNILGAARLSSGMYENVKVELLRPTEGGEEYSVVIYRDNGDRNFDFNFDSLVIDGTMPVSKNFIAN